ncbi:MAG: hypothetical protein A2Z77_05970 [Chloroflexi bacterium RBG_13_51_36]|nr:MAG: hypothetical protein A2Z77_05970 [Chloroflexi bacterium RBG_13_51_36]
MLQAPLAVAGKSNVKRRPVPLVNSAGDVRTGRSVKRMDSFDLEPKHSTRQIPGKCIKCLAEQELNNCLLELLTGAENDEKLQQRYEMLLAFLKSPESQKLRDESEKCLAEGERVMLKLSFADGEPKYELKID